METVVKVAEVSILITNGFHDSLCVKCELTNKLSLDFVVPFSSTEIYSKFPLTFFIAGAEENAHSMLSA